MNIVNGIRPKIITGTPLKYKNLVEQCWNADPSKRPNIVTLYNKMQEINKVYYQNTSNELFQSEINNKSEINKTSNLVCYTSISKVHQFENLPEPKNATEGKLYLFNLFSLLF